MMNMDSLSDQAKEIVQKILDELRALAPGLMDQLTPDQMESLGKSIGDIANFAMLAWIDRSNRAQHLQTMRHAYAMIGEEALIAQMRANDLLKNAVNNVIFGAAKMIVELL
jgi:hypothetical protein